MFQSEPELVVPTEQPPGGDAGVCRPTVAEAGSRRHHSLGATIAEIDPRKHPLRVFQQLTPLRQDGA